MTPPRLTVLQALLHREVPLSRHMGVVPHAYDGDELTLQADLQPNINIHGTAFGGSLYSLAALCGWSLLRLRLEDASLSAEIMLGSARIDYHKPVRSKLIARAACESVKFEAFESRVKNGNRAGIEVPVSLGTLEAGQWQQAAVFHGMYATV